MVNSRSDPSWDATLGDQVQPASRVLTLNVSRINDFRRCRRMFFLRWVLRVAGVDDHESDAAWIGSSTHEALHALHVVGATEQHVGGEASLAMSATDPRVGQMIRTHMLLCPGGDAEYLGGEIEARWLLVRKAVLLTGRFDAVWRYPDGTVEVRDYKTGRCPDSLDDDLGAAIYLLLAANHPSAALSRSGAGPLRPVRVVYESLASPDGRLVSVTATRTLLREALSEVVGLAEHIRREKTFPPTASASNCGSCSYKHSCPYSEARRD